MFDVFIAVYLYRVYCVHSCCVRLCCVFVIHRSQTHTDVLVGLLINGSMYICVSVVFVFILFNVKH